jgi:hypothetical protein
LTSNIVKGLNDKLYDKRKVAAIEVEKYANMTRGIVSWEAEQPLLHAK